MRKTLLFLSIGLALVLVRVPGTAQIHVGKNVLVSAAHRNLVHDEVLLSADPTDPNRLIGCSLGVEQGRSFVDLGGGYGNQWYGIAYMSDDAGHTWRLATQFAPTSNSLGLDNHCGFGADGTAFFITGVLVHGGNESANSDDLDHKANHYDYLAVRRSTDHGHTWSSWESPPESIGIDRQYVVADDSNGPYRGRVYITGQTDVNDLDNKPVGTALTIWRSLDDGATFQRPIKRLSQYVGPESGSVYNPWNPVVLSNGTLALLYRDLTGDKANPSALNILFSRNGGETVSKSYKVADVNNPDPPASLAADRTNGPFKNRLYVAWPDTKAKTLPSGSGVRRNILLAYSEDQGKTWSKPIVVNDDRDWPVTNALSNKGPDDTEPQVVVNRAGVVGVMWLDRRNNPQNHGYSVRFSASLDGGDTWLPSVAVSEKPDTYLGREKITARAHTLPSGQTQIIRDDWIEGGHMHGLAADGAGRFQVIWVDNHTGIQQLWSSAIHVDGHAENNGSLALSSFVDLTKKLELQIDSTSYDPKTQTVSVTARLKNISKQTIRGPIKARLTVLQSDFAVPHVANAQNGMTGTGAVWDFTQAGALKPNALSQTKTLVFRLQNARPIDIEPHEGVYSTSIVTFQTKILGKP